TSSRGLITAYVSLLPLLRQPSFFMLRRPPSSPLFPYTTLFRSGCSFSHAPRSRNRGSACGNTGNGYKRRTSNDPSVSRQRRHDRSEEHTSELQSPCNLVCRLLLEKKKKQAVSEDFWHASSEGGF